MQARTPACFGAALVFAAAMYPSFTLAADLAIVAGHVMDTEGRPIAGARVFLEPGLEGTLRVVQTDSEGGFKFEDVLPGMTGVFAHARGRALNGTSVRVAAADRVTDLRLVLAQPGVTAGVVTDERGDAVSGARITRAVILGDSGVGIPFAKLASQGIAEPATDRRGRFAIDSLPNGMPIALKVAHPDYAQEGVGGIEAGDRTVAVTLTRGVLVTGTVLARGQNAPVANTTIFFHNAEPPHDTVITRSRTDGSFAVRLTPGPWVYKASGAQYRTANLQRILISGEYAAQDVTLRVAPTATLRGSVKDAKTGEPVPDARLVFESFGVPAASARTGASGAYELSATEGEGVLRLAAVPGYLTPPKPALRITATGGRHVDIPTFWVAPIPNYTLEVVDQNDQPVAGAIVRVFRPRQVGWRATDAEGRVDLSFVSMPSDGTVVGLAEHPSRPEAALFAIGPERAGDAIVELLPLTELTTEVVDDRGDGLEGVVVESRTALETFDDTVALWRTVSAKDGRLVWPALVPHVAQLCVASAAEPDDSGALARGESTAFIPRPNEPVTLDPIVVPGGTKGRSALGKDYAWHTHELLCGELPGADARDTSAAIVMHTAADQAAVMADSLARVRELLDRPNLIVAVVTDGGVRCPDSAVPILRGSAPGPATTYLVDASGTVVLESFDLPPLSMINAVAPIPED